MIPRHIQTLIERSKKSVLLLGPRQTGKSTLMRGLSPSMHVNLANETTYLEFARNPNELEQRLAGARHQTVFVDEVQRLPCLLNTIQCILDETPTPPKFYLTGSSARKLKRGRANLLPGRIHAYHLGPLVAAEMDYSMDINQALSTGTLPGIWTESDAAERTKTLQSYAAVYLREEIQAEALSRNIEGFSRFLFVIAAYAGRFLDLAKLSGEAGISRQTARRFFEILEDTLIIRRCNAFRKSLHRRLVQSPRFFFFDTGVLNGLLNNYTVSADRVGVLFEHLLFNQISDSAAAKDKNIRVSSYRTEHGAEIDMIIETEDEVIALEAKASSNIGRGDLTGFKSFAEYFGKKHQAVIAYLGSVPKVVEGIHVLPWQTLLKHIGL